MIEESILVRTYRSEENRAAAGQFSVIIWPLEPASNQPGDVTCWHYIGQHGGADLAYLIRATRPATEEETRKAIAQWRYEGPGRTESDIKLRILKRAPAWSRIMEAHRKELAR